MGRQFRNYGILAVVIIFGAYYAVLWTGLFSRYWTGILAMSVATFALYGIDKSQAVMFQQEARNRVPENLLHLLALLGGFLGGWAGMFVFWHKVRKPVFWVVLAVATALHVALKMTVF